jgi:regulatory protein
VSKIVILQLNKSNKRVDVILADSSSFTIDRKVAEEAGLRKGVDLSPEQLNELTEADIYRRCYDSALNFLASRPRSELEIKQRLRRNGFNDEIINRVAMRLREQNLIDDIAFAEYWKENRLSSKPRGKRLIKYELLRKGIPGDTVGQAIGDIDDNANAYKAGKRKARLLYSLSYEEFRKRLSNYLKWRGFSYEVIYKVTESLWKEKQNLSK